MTISSTTTSDREKPALLSAAWRAGGLVYLVVCATGLAAGLFANHVYPPRGILAAPLPALSSLAAGQGLFILLGWPLLCLWRTERGRTRRFAAEALVEAVAWTIVPAPLYVSAAWLADATAVDAARTAVAAAALWPVAIGAGALLRARASLRPAVLLALLILAALPAVWYVWREFLGAMPAGWLWNLGPASYLWQAGAARQAGAIPSPAWPMAAWLAAAAGLATLAAVLRTRR